MNVDVCDDCVVLAAALVADAAALPYLCALVAVVLVPAPPLTVFREHDRMHIGAYVPMCMLCFVVFASVCGSRRRGLLDRHVCVPKPGMMWFCEREVERYVFWGLSNVEGRRKVEGRGHISKAEGGGDWSSDFC